jgi:RNA polymerase sigma-70 factor (ECF subfamily)
MVAVGTTGDLDPVTTDFVECYRVHYPRLLRALRLAGADPSTAEDLAQEAFARALVRWRRVRRGANPPGYVYRTGFRLLARRRAPSSELTDSATPAGPGPEGEATTRVAVAAVLAAMPPRRRQCATLCLVVGLSVHEAAEALGIADGTVRKHLDEARAALRAGT